MHKPHAFLLASVVSSLALTACGTTTKYVATNPPPRAMQPRPAQTVEVYTATHPDRPFVEVGILESQQSSEYSRHDMADIIGSMRNKAAKIGCDGVIIVGPNDTIAGSDTVAGTDTTRTRNGSQELTYASTTTHTLKGYRGVCIMYREEPVSVAP